MLYLVATPIGDLKEITLRALDVLKSAEVLICESTKEASKLLKALNLKDPGQTTHYEVLDEHSTAEDLQALLKLCQTKTVALVSDCGTPGFCDPGNDLIALCRKNDVLVKSVLGASSLMGLLSLSSQKIDQFVFRGFIPADSEKRKLEWNVLKKEKRAFVLMDTPYRLKKMIDEVAANLENRTVMLALNLSQENETILEGKPSVVKKQLKMDKAEFMLLVYPEK